jgi:hypothetical protein
MAYLWRQGILTLHARTPINTDLSRKLCAIAAAGDARERGGKRVDAQFTGDPKQPHGDKSEYRPLTQGRERVGASPQEYRPLTQESAVKTSKIQTFRTRNADLSRKEYRPFAQGITDRRRKGLPTAGARTTPNTDLSHK